MCNPTDGDDVLWPQAASGHPTTRAFDTELEYLGTTMPTLRNARLSVTVTTVTYRSVHERVPKKQVVLSLM